MELEQPVDQLRDEVRRLNARLDRIAPDQEAGETID